MVVDKDVGDDEAAATRTGGMSAVKMHQENAAGDLGKQHLPPETKTRQTRPGSKLDTVAARAEHSEEDGVLGGGIAATAGARSA